jgi:enamine deaminase RidA (YjgF/YER057c/UK114 family)
MTQRTAIFPAGRRELYERNKYSAAVTSGGFLFVSGQVGSKEDGSPHAEPEAQLRLAFAHRVRRLPLAGAGLVNT